MDLSNLPCWDGAESLRYNICSALGRGLKELSPELPHDRPLNLAAFGPSLTEQSIPDGELWCVNGAHDWLISQGRIPDVCVLLDPTPDLSGVITPHNGVKYLIASQCHPDLFDRLKEADVTLWHAWVPKESTGEDIRDLVNTPGQHWFISGGGTAALRALVIAKFLGYRDISVYGLDSSFEGERKHAVEPHPCAGNECEVEYGGKIFQTNIPLAAQAENFEAQYIKVLNDVRIRVHGTGLIPWICESLNKLKYGERNV